jgi:hypothetical protein
MPRGMAQALQSLPSKHEALSSNPSTMKKKGPKWKKPVTEGYVLYDSICMSCLEQTSL